MSSPDITAAEAELTRDVVLTGHLSIGPKVTEFESALADFVGTHHAVAVNSGTSGLHLAVIGAGVNADDLAITSPFSFVASANALLYERAIPIFVDVDPTTGNVDAALVAEAAAALTTGSGLDRWLPPSHRTGIRPTPDKLKAILPIHCFGQPAAMNELGVTARAHSLKLIEDACEAIGAEYNGRRVGTFGDSAVFAFYPNKQMTTGEGGMVVTSDVELRDLFRSLRNQGRDVFDAWLNHSRLGYNYRMSELNAALGLIQTQRLPELLERRERVATWYTRRLENEAPLINVPTIVPTTTRMSWFVYVVRLAESVDRRSVLTALESEGVPSRPYFSPIHLQPFYRERFGYERGSFPVTEALSEHCLAIPFSGIMTEEQVDYVVTRLVRAVHKHRQRPTKVSHATVASTHA